VPQEDPKEVESSEEHAQQYCPILSLSRSPGTCVRIESMESQVSEKTDIPRPSSEHIAESLGYEFCHSASYSAQEYTKCYQVLQDLIPQ